MIRLALVAACLSLVTGCGWGVTVGTGEDRRSPLEKAAESGDVEKVNQLLASGADANGAGVSGSPLIAAVLRNNNSEIIRRLIAAGANPNGRLSDGRWAPPLSAAASMGDLENIRVLLDAGASVHQTQFPVVAGWLRRPVVELLVQRGLDLQAVDEKGRNALHLALEPPVVASFEGVEYLVSSGVAVNARDSSGKTPLAYWRQPRDFEVHWLRAWLFSHLSDNSEFERSHTDRVRISALLQRSGATL